VIENEIYLRFANRKDKMEEKIFVCCGEKIPELCMYSYLGRGERINYLFVSCAK
jgi:hypothetical protein